ncbi:MAG TPA: hypothetical protein VN207_05925 [Ktedonobacteraceae bacterium]|nr:hypothetical protein [Ktedonobacteraceae bacterium]
MPQDTEKYLYFKVGLLKDSFALEALWQDALRYHMIDQPAKLIAMRLTEYYELTKKGPVHSTENIPMPMPSATSTPAPTASTSIPTTSTAPSDKRNKEEVETPTSSTPAIRPSATGSPVAHPPVVRPAARPATPALNTKVTSTTADQAGAVPPEGELSLAVSLEVDQNAEEAADYWSLL